MTFCVWRLSLSIMFSGFIYALYLSVYQNHLGGSLKISLMGFHEGRVGPRIRISNKFPGLLQLLVWRPYFENHQLTKQRIKGTVI